MTRNEESLQTLFSNTRIIKSSTGTIHCVYLSDITPTEWTKDMALAAIKNSVTNYGYYEYNGKKGFCIVGDFEDIYNFIESVGHVVDEDNLYHWKEFPWDNAKKLDKRYSGQDYWNREGITNSRRPIKSAKKYVIAYNNHGDTGYVGPGVTEGDVGKNVKKAIQFDTYDEAEKEMKLLEPEWCPLHIEEIEVPVQSSRKPIKSTHLLKSGRQVSVTGEPYSEDYVNGWGYGRNENGIKDKVLEEWDDYYRGCARSGAEAYKKGLTLNDNPYLDEKSFGTTKFAEYWELGWKGEKEREQEERDYQKYLWEREKELENDDRYDDRYYD